MKLQELKEAGSALGVVLSTRKGKFYDIDFVDYNTQDPLTGHWGNLAKHFISLVKEHNAWEHLIPFFKKRFKAKKLGEDYSSEDADFYLLGPMTEQHLNMLDEEFEEEYLQ